MGNGKFTGELGYALAKEYASTRYSIYYAHKGDKGVNEPNKLDPTPFFHKISNATTLSVVDIAILDRETATVVLVAEIEESGANPKKIIGDVMNLSFAEQIQIAGRIYSFAQPLDFILGLKVNARGQGAVKAQNLCQKLAEVNQYLRREIRLTLVCKEDAAQLARAVKVKITEILDR